MGLDRHLGRQAFKPPQAGFLVSFAKAAVARNCSENG